MTTTEFRAAVLEHEDRVHDYARSILRDPDDAKDAAQDCLVRLWSHRERFEPCAPRPELVAPLGAQPLGRSAQATVVASGDRPGGTRRGPDGRPSRLRTPHLTGRDRRPLERALLDVKLGIFQATLHRAREKLRRALVRVKATP